METPRPWTVESWVDDDDAAFVHVVTPDAHVAEAVRAIDARLIVRAVNAHSDLVDTLRGLVEMEQMDTVDGDLWDERYGAALAALKLAEAD